MSDPANFHPDTPLTLPGQTINGAKERELIARLDKGTVAVRYYKSMNVATSMAAKLNKRWANQYLGMDVRVFTRTCEDGAVGVYVQQVGQDQPSEVEASRG